MATNVDSCVAPHFYGEQEGLFVVVVIDELLDSVGMILSFVSDSFFSSYHIHLLPSFVCGQLQEN